MIGLFETAEKLGFKSFSEIPERLIYEEWDGVPILYKGVADFIKKGDDLNQIEMGSSIFQSIICDFILEILYKSHLDRKKYLFATNEVGIHLGYRNNRANDIAIFLREKIKDKRSTKYAEVPPEVVVEVDVNADYSKEFLSFDDYIEAKTQSLLDFGVKKVIWIISTQPQYVRISTKNSQTIFADWNETVEILDGVSFCLDNIDLE